MSTRTKHVQLMVRPNCGSCHRVAGEIRPVIAAAEASFEICDVTEDLQLEMEFGDRVPVVVIDGEEFACWEVDTEDLAHALLS